MFDRSIPYLAAIALLCARGPAQTTTIVSVSSSGVQGNGESFGSSVSADGRHVAFSSRADNLLGGLDANGMQLDVFGRGRISGTTELGTRSAPGVRGNA